MPRQSSKIERTCLKCGKIFLAKRYEVEFRGGGIFCSRLCYGAGLPIEERFWAKVNKTDDCWLWTGGKFTDGYGAFHIHSERRGRERRPQKAHRFSYELAYGPIAIDIMVCHHCDIKYPPGDITYRLCVRPAHLFLGTNDENMADMAAKRRSVLGTRNSNAKVTEDDVKKIRKLYALGNHSAEAIGRLFGIGPTSTFAIIHRQTWKHVASS